MSPPLGGPPEPTRALAPAVPTRGPPRAPRAPGPTASAAGRRSPRPGRAASDPGPRGRGFPAPAYREDPEEAPLGSVLLCSAGWAQLGRPGVCSALGGGAYSVARSAAVCAQPQARPTPEAAAMRGMREFQVPPRDQSEPQITSRRAASPAPAFLPGGGAPPGPPRPGPRVCRPIGGLSLALPTPHFAHRAPGVRGSVLT